MEIERSAFFWDTGYNNVLTAAIFTIGFDNIATTKKKYCIPRKTVVSSKAVVKRLTEP